MADTISFSDFTKMEIKIGKIISAESVEGANKLLKLKVNTGEERQLVAGIAETYPPKKLVGKENESISEEHIPPPDEIGRIMHYFPLIGQAITMVLASSGMRPGECLQINLHDLELERDPPRINLRSSTTKTK